MNPADVELDELIDLFYKVPAALGAFTEVGADDLPAPSRHLLAHDHHMTVTVEDFHGCDVDVEVLESRFDDGHYSRKILLTRQSDGQVVMFGIVRLDVSVLSAEVRREIEAQQIPLGRILIDHNVLRSVKLLSLFRIDSGNDLVQCMGLASGTTCYGRTALIYCDGAPAIELLEVVGS